VNLSFKTGGRSIGSVANGGQDAWIDSIGAAIKARSPKPLFITFYHEPENDFVDAGSAAQLRAASRRIVQRWRASGVKNFTFVSTHFMTSWTFNGSGRDWRWWYPDWKGTTRAGSSEANPDASDFYAGADSVVDVIGYDIYNWWEPGKTASHWTSFQSQADYALSRHRVLGKPKCVGEMGTMAYEVNGVIDEAKTRAYFNDAYAYMLANDFVCAQYWDNHFTSTWDARLETHDPKGIRMDAFSALLSRATTLVPKL
jgi:hypothetical protein